MIEKLRKKLMLWTFAGIAFLLVFFAVIMIIIAPIIWAAQMADNIIGDPASLPGGTKMTDYRELLDAEGASSRKAFSYAEFLSCAMNEEKDGSVGACLMAIGNDGEFSEDVDTSFAEIYRVHAAVNEFKGALPNSGYEDLWVPDLYHKEHYKEVVTKTDPKTGEILETEWQFDYTEDTIYKDACDENKPATACVLFREGYWTYPYINAAGEGTQPTQRYGYDATVEEDGMVSFLNGVEYGAKDLKSMSTGVIENVSADDLGGSQVTLHISHNGLDFYTRYRRLSSVSVHAGQEVEIKDSIGHSDNSLIETYMLVNGVEQFFNPYLLYGDVVFLEGDQHSGVFTGNQGTMSAAEVGEALSGLSWTPPFEYRITANFAAQGIKVWGANGHNGIDLVPASGAASGHEILCGMEGVVTGQGYNSISGNYIEVQSSSNPRVAVRYCHMLKPANYSVGSSVSAGVVLGYVGSTGASTGPHTHISLVIDGNFYNPNLLYRF